MTEYKLVVVGGKILYAMNLLIASLGFSAKNFWNNEMNSNSGKNLAEI
jgi:hypothetical protein